jgi:hypothetical protein
LRGVTSSGNPETLAKSTQLTSAEKIHLIQAYLQPSKPLFTKKKGQKENQEPSPVVDTSALEDKALKGFHNPAGLPTAGCYSLYKLPGYSQSKSRQRFFEIVVSTFH